MTVMLYKHPGPHKIHNGNFDYIVVDRDKVEETIASGWAKTTEAALEAAEEPKKRGRQAQKKKG